MANRNGKRRQISRRNVHTSFETCTTQTTGIKRNRCSIRDGNNSGIMSDEKIHRKRSVGTSTEVVDRTRKASKSEHSLLRGNDLGSKKLRIRYPRGEAEKTCTAIRLNESSFVREVTSDIRAMSGPGKLDKVMIQTISKQVAQDIRKEIREKIEKEVRLQFDRSRFDLKDRDSCEIKPRSPESRQRDSRNSRRLRTTRIRNISENSECETTTESLIAKCKHIIWCVNR